MTDEITSSMSVNTSTIQLPSEFSSTKVEVKIKFTL
jgi:hypothetical protein